MMRKIFGPSHTFRESLLILEQGLRNGEITLSGQEEPGEAVDLYVPLVDEGTTVLRPAKGRLLGPGLFRLLATTDPTTEKWAFPPGCKVRCVPELREGRKLLVARQRID